MKRIDLQITGLIVLLFLTILFNSCIFNKEIRQDAKLNAFRSEFHVVLDSLDDSSARLVAFDSLITHISKDKDIVSDRKRNKLLTEVYNAMGNEYYVEGRYNEAVEILSKPIEMDGKNPDGYYNRGCAYHAAGKYNQAITDYNQAISLKSDFTNAIYNRALAYETIENYKHALSDYKKVISLNPSYKVDAYYKMGAVYQDMAEYDKAINTFDEAIGLDSSNVEGYLLKGDVYLERKMYDSVIAEYNKALNITPDDLQIIYKRGKIHELNGDIKEAQKDFEHVLNTNSDEDISLEKAAKKGIKELSRVKKSSQLRARK